ncbi:MAG: hypothetical protein ACK5MD_09885 [Flavobacteriales bacterium]
MKRIIYIVFMLSFWVVSCNPDKQKTFTSLESNNPIKNLETPDSTIFQTIIKGTDCNKFSEAMINFIELLKHDNNEIETKGNQKELWFTSYKEDPKAEKTIIVSRNSFKTIFVKRKNKLERMGDNWYPSFSVTEICFQNEQTALENERNISEIINSFDLSNEKSYDYILNNGNRLIYVSCGAKIFEEYTFAYKEKMEEIIKNSKYQQKKNF